MQVDKGQLKPDGGKVLEMSLKLTPEVKVSFKGSKGADLGVDYVKGNFYGTAVLDVLEMSKLSTSACLGLPSGIKVGGSTSYALSGSSGFGGFNVGASYATGPIFASVTATNKKAVSLGLLYKVNGDLSLGSMTTHSTDKACTVLGLGGAYKAPVGTIKAKFASDGIVSASLVREIAPKVVLTATGSVSPSDLSTFKPGIQISM